MSVRTKYETTTNKTEGEIPEGETAKHFNSSLTCQDSAKSTTLKPELHSRRAQDPTLLLVSAMAHTDVQGHYIKKKKIP